MNRSIYWRDFELIDHLLALRSSFSEPHSNSARLIPSTVCLGGIILHLGLRRSTAVEYQADMLSESYA